MPTEYANVFINVNGCSGRIGLDEMVGTGCNLSIVALIGIGRDLSLQHGPGQFNEMLNLSDLPAEMYLLQAVGVPIRTDKRSFAKKLMVVR